MLNRRILRIKAFKELFAIEMSQEKSLAAAKKELDLALESTRDLYIFMLASIVPLTAVARDRINQLQKKINKTEEEKNPNLKFVNNSLAEIFAEDIDFQKILKDRGLDNKWGAFDLILRKVYASMQTKAYFTKYMASPVSSLEEDCALFTKIFEEEFVDLPEFAEALEDMNLYWNDDLAYSLTFCCKTLEYIACGGRWKFPELYMSEIIKTFKIEEIFVRKLLNLKDDKKFNSKLLHLEDDRKFVHKLFQEAFMNYDEYYAAISASVANWDRDRLVGTDIALIVTALAEIVHFPNIPVKVSINEYVEISKYYGTPKSSVFVNGILDTLSKKVEFKKL